MVELKKGIARLIKKACSSSSNPHPSMVSFEERYANEVFEHPHAATHSRLSHGKQPRRTAKAQALGDEQRLRN
jgi:hypothetical protein